MSDRSTKQDRRSTRLSISIPVVISGEDAHGKNFSESVRTLIVNKHGGKIASAHLVPVGKEVTIENRAMGVAAKATVVWLGASQGQGDLHHVGLQLLEAQNVWGIVFPPEDWSLELQETPPPAEGESTPSGEATAADQAEEGGVAGDSTDAEAMDARIPSLAGEEIAIRLLQELQGSADEYAREFQERMKQLTQRLGLEMEFNLRERLARSAPREGVPLDEEIRSLREDLSSSCEEIRKLEAKIQQLQNGAPGSKEGSLPSPTSVQEARRQLTTLANSVVESMNRAAQAGLNDYRALLRKENQKSAARLGSGADDGTPPAAGAAREG